MPNMLVPHNRLAVDESDAQRVAKTVLSGHWAMGPCVSQLESRLAKLAGVKYAVCVASGSSALKIGLQTLGVRAGDRVLVPAYCCVAIPNSVSALDSIPICADVSMDSWNIAQSSISAQAQPETIKAAIAVNTFGVPFNLPLKEHRAFPVIEDCAHALGIDGPDGRLGGRTEVAITSFYATKLLGCGEGGAIFTDSEQIAEHAMDCRDYTDKDVSKDRCNAKMTDINASLLLCQLDRLEQTLNTRKQIAIRYFDALSSLSKESNLFSLPDMSNNSTWYRFVIRLKSIDLLRVIETLLIQGVHAAIPVTDWRQKKERTQPTANLAYESLLSLPIYPSLTGPEQDHVIRSLKLVIQQSS